MINLDPLSIAITIFYVTILYIFLSRFFFGPISKILDERKQLTVGRLESAQQKLAEVDRKTAEYEQTIRAAKAEAYRKQEVSREEALAARSALISKTKAEADKTVQEARARFLQE